MDKMAHVLGEIKSIKAVAQARRVHDALRRNWVQIFGKLADEIELDFFRDSVVVVSTKNPMWQTELAYFKPMILENIRRVVGLSVTDIRIVSGVFETNKSKRIIPTQLKTLEEMVRNENLAKRASGMKLCNVCDAVYTFGDRCIFCAATGA